MKKTVVKIIIFTIVMMMIIQSSALFADGQDKDRRNTGELVNSQIFKNTTNIPDVKTKKIDDIQKVVVYTPGTVRIDDVRLPEGGYVTNPTASFSSYESAKYTLVTVIPYVPVIGRYAETLMQIYDGLRAVESDLNNFDGNRRTDVQTKYNYMDFYHDLYVYDNNNQWKYVGHSLSREFYKYTYMYYFNTSLNSYDDVSWFYNRANGYGPCIVAEAPNYMNYTQLRSNAYEAWVYNTSYNESY